MKFTLFAPQDTIELDCKKIILSAINGKMVILPGHETYLASIKPSLVTILIEKDETAFIVYSGVMSINLNIINLYTRFFLLVDNNVNDKINKDLDTCASYINKAESDNSNFIEYYKSKQNCLIEFQNIIKHNLPC